MFEIVIASRNKEKKRELKALLKVLKINPALACKGGIKVLDLNDFSSAPKVEETGKTFEDNAAVKAVSIAKFSKKLALADDSGLEVKAINGKPGIRSARFAGENATYDKNNRKLLRLLKDVPKSKRKARFVCVIAIADKDGLVGTRRGECGGWITFEPKGTNGFGYDPVFFSPKYKKTFAELTRHQKNMISHRSRALRRAKALIQSYLRKALS